MSALAASLGTCTHYGGIATGIVTCSGNSGWQLFLLLALFPFPYLESEASEHCRGTDTGLHTDPLSEPNGTFLFERTMPACFLLSSERLYISFLRAIPPSPKLSSNVLVVVLAYMVSWAKVSYVSVPMFFPDLIHGHHPKCDLSGRHISDCKVLPGRCLRTTPPPLDAGTASVLQVFWETRAFSYVQLHSQLRVSIPRTLGDVC